MGKIRYYCDYCDRSFLDDLEVRKRHLNGTRHIRQCKQYYDQFRDAKTILEEESKAEQCKRYIIHGNCAFGDNCKYSHYSPADIESLRQQIEIDEASKARELSVEAALEKIPSVDKINMWLTTRLNSKEGEKCGKSLFTDFLVNSIGSSPLLEGYTNLPPSLLPWNLNAYEVMEFSEWG